ncbi:MAG TPA: aldehyde dehydrogenase family protein [Acidimicrobiia bacterium]|nr:aldehyde dehydrogenase family protein [Acidimicrobiia bacterium]
MTVPLFPRDVPPWVGGRALDVEKWTEVRDPYRGELAARVAVSDANVVDQAVTRAVAAQQEVAALPAYERARILRRAADILAGRAQELAEAITRQTGKVLRDTTREANRAPWTLRAAATAAETVHGTVHSSDAMPQGEGITSISYRQPVGVVGAVTPFNAPLNLTVHKVAPAIAAGNAIVVKPASPAPITAIDLAHILEEAGLPAGAMNVVPGGPDTGSALVGHPQINLITFTGGPAAGEAIRRRAGFRRVLLELGGNSPNLVHHDANLTQACDAALRGGFANGGQSCNSVQRLLVHRDVYQQMTALLVDGAKGLVSGDPLDPATEVGPVVNEESARRVISWIEDAAHSGAEVLCGGSREGALIAPTVVAGTPSTCQLFTDEIFAPVVLINPYESLEEALELANSTVYGLQAAIFTSSLDVALEAGRRLKAGGVMVNRSSNFRLDHLPYGGIGESGMGREGPMFALEEMTELKVVVIASSELDPR